MKRTRGVLRRAVAALGICAGSIASVSADVPDPPAVKELRVWILFTDPGREAAFRRFEREYPGYRIVLSTTTPDSAVTQQKLMTAVAGGSPPDALMFSRFAVGEWAVRGALTAQDELVRESARREALCDAVTSAVASGRPDDAKGAVESLLRDYEAFPGSLISRTLLTLKLALAGESEGADLAAAEAARLRELLDGVHEEEFYEACWKEGSFREAGVERPYTIPFTTDARALYYNEDLLERAGLVDESGKAKPPRDWDELKEYAKILTRYDSGGRITQLGFAPNYGNSWLYLYGWQNGGSFMSDDGRRCTMNGAPVVEALQYMKDVYGELGGLEKVDVFQSAAENLGEHHPFLTGKAAMLIDVDLSLKNICETMPGLRFGVVPAPPPAGKKAITWSGGFAWAIPSGAADPKAAFELIRFLMSERNWKYEAEVNARNAASRGRAFLPGMAPMPEINRVLNEIHVAGNPELPSRVKQYFPLFFDLMEVSRYRPVTPAGQLLWDEHIRAYDKAVRGTLSPQDALDRSQRAVQAQIDVVFSDVKNPPVDWSRAAWIAGLLTLLGGGAAAVAYGPRREEARAGLLMASPWIFGFAVLTAGPVVVSFLTSFSRYDVLNPAEWVGLENYRQMLFHDPLFWKALGNTAYMMIGVPLGMAAGLGIAMLLNSNVRGMTAYRTLFYMPAIVPLVASSVLWLWVLNPSGGLVNTLLRTVGVEDLPLWLNSPTWLLGSKASFILMGLWGAGAGMIVWLAGLNGIPGHLYEAAEVDGAGPIRRFFAITLPMLSPYIFFNAVIGVIATMQIFTQAYIMTGGGPDDSTMFFAYHLFNHAFRYFNMGYASAMAYVLFLIVLALTLIQMAAAKRWVYYEND